ncbi:MAG: fumarylacetoacetate hydrolase family protein [Armatimonadetes bacterium]|nr:fumarylacetoacetate hydrolase family protein [Armatimonadota bacterium]
MRFISYTIDGEPRVGIEKHGRAIDLERAYAVLADDATAERLFGGGDLKAVLERGFEAMEAAQRVDEAAGESGAVADNSHSLDRVQLRAPIPRPEKVICVGQNYRDHCLEQGAPIPELPILFAKFPTSIQNPGGPVLLPVLSEQVDYEAELAVVIGTQGKHIPMEDAYAYVAGYTCANDVSARDIQFGDKQWVRGKSFDTSCPLGPALVTPDEIPDPQTLGIRCVLNGKTMQDSNTNQLIFNVPYLIWFISKMVTLNPGDVILTGTPPGVGIFRDPPVLLKPGDTVTIEIDRIGSITNPVTADEG